MSSLLYIGSSMKDQKCIYSFCFLDRYLQLQLKKMSNKFGPLFSLPFVVIVVVVSYKYFSFTKAFALLSRGV